MYPNLSITGNPAGKQPLHAEIAADAADNKARMPLLRTALPGQASRPELAAAAITSMATTTTTTTTTDTTVTTIVTTTGTPATSTGVASVNSTAPLYAAPNASGMSFAAANTSMPMVDASQQAPAVAPEDRQVLWLAKKVMKGSLFLTPPETERMVKALAVLLKSPDCTINKLDFSYWRSSLSKSAMLLLAQALKANRTVSELMISERQDKAGHDIHDEIEPHPRMHSESRLQSVSQYPFLGGGMLAEGGWQLAGRESDSDSRAERPDPSKQAPGFVAFLPLFEALRDNATLTRLGLFDVELKDAGIAALSKALSFNRTLTSLSLRGFDIDSFQLELFDMLIGNATLTELKLEKGKINAAGGMYLAHAIRCNSSLVMLAFDDVTIQSPGAHFLAKMPDTNCTLTALSLCNAGIDDKGMALLAKALEINSTLARLELSIDGDLESSAQGGDAGMAALGEALKVNASLTGLRLSCKKISGTGAASLSKALQVNHALTELSLNFSQLDDAGASILSDGLQINSTLGAFGFSCNEMNDAGKVLLLAALRRNRSLVKVHFIGWQIGAVGAAELSEGLKTNSTLTTLELANTGIGDAGASALSEGLKLNSTLARLDLRHNAIGDSGASALAEMLKSNSTLTGMYLWSNRIGDAGAANLLEALNLNSSLIHLDVWDDPGFPYIEEIRSRLAANDRL